MKSIEERAWDYAVSFRQGDSVFAEGYIQGATDQKAIDDADFADASKIVIDKACEWLEKHSEFWVYDDGFMCVAEMLDNFRKAMEE